MKKLTEIQKVLDFYVRSNELKNTIIDEPNNYSVADHLFGSMILATAIDSEFKETDNLAHIYRMMLLSEYSTLYPKYKFDTLKQGKQFQNEINEAKEMHTSDSKLVFKYKMLDFLLTKLIKEKESQLELSELINEGKTIIALLCGKSPSECEEIFKFYYLNFRLKDKTRTGWDKKHWNIKSDRIETVSEHIIGTLSLALALNSEFEYNLDINKVLKMLAIHETGETLIGDITPFDGITQEQKEEMEHKAMHDALNGLQESEILLDLLFEFDEQKTSEARFSHYCDKIEADLQAKIYQDKGLQHPLDDQKDNCVFNSSRVQEMVKNGAQDAFDIWYEWDRPIYEGDTQFEEFSKILKIAKSNNMLHLDKVVKEQISLTDEEHSFLSQELATIINRLYGDENIDSMYLTNYQDMDHDKGTLYIVALLKGSFSSFTYSALMERINSEVEEKNTTGINVAFDYNYLYKYSVTAMNPSEVHGVEQLVESTILFDKSGQISSVQEKMKKYGHLYAFHLVDYAPPIDQAITYKIGKKE